MNPGPKAGAAKRAGMHVANAVKAWGEHPPAWVMALARAADATSQTEAGSRIGYSNGAVSQVINNRYPGDMEAVEQAARLLAEKVDCPVLGLTPADDCLSNQQAGFATASPMAVRLAAACQTCAHRRGGKHG